MEERKYIIHNQARGTSVGTGVTAINSSLEPLAALRVMVEGLESDNEAGLWLTHVTVLPMVPRMSPFDLVYLDKDDRVVERAELLPTSEIPRFKKPSASALVLPFRTISLSKIELGDQFSVQESCEEEVQGAEENEIKAAPSPAARVSATAISSSPIEREDQVSLQKIPSRVNQKPEDKQKDAASVLAQAFAAQEENRESSEEVETPIKEVATPAPEVVTPIFGSWFRMEREAERRRQPEPDPIEKKEAQVAEVSSAIEQVPQEPRDSMHWTKATASAEMSITESPRIQEVPLSQNLNGSPEPATPIAKHQSNPVEPPATDRSIHLEPPKPLGEETAHEAPDELEKQPLVNRFMRWLYPSLYEKNRRSSERRPSPGLVAYELSGNSLQMHEVDNISSTGIYLRTNGRWEPGEQVSLTLQRTGPPEENPQQRIEFQAGAIRAGNDGVGLSFVLPEGMDLKLWESPERQGIYEAEADGLLRELRMARALAFLRRICPPAAEEIKEMFHKTLSSVRVANAVEIAFKAERLLLHEPNALAMVAHPGLMVRILEHGTWVDVEWIQELWAGLLATSCTFEGQDESNLVFINLLSRMAPLPTQILTAACAKATRAMAESASVSPYLLVFSAEEMAKITRSNNLVKIYRSISELSELGLLEHSSKPSSHASLESAKAKPTNLGLQMYARCQGIRGAA